MKDGSLARIRLSLPLTKMLNIQNEMIANFHMHIAMMPIGYKRTKAVNDMNGNLY